MENRQGLAGKLGELEQRLRQMSLTLTPPFNCSLNGDSYPGTFLIALTGPVSSTRNGSANTLTRQFGNSCIPSWMR